MTVTRDEIEARVARLLVEHLGVPDDALRPDADLLDEMGLDSITLLELVTLLEDTFDVEIDDADVDRERLRSVRTIAGFVTTLVEGP